MTTIVTIDISFETLPKAFLVHSRKEGMSISPVLLALPPSLISLVSIISSEVVVFAAISMDFFSDWKILTQKSWYFEFRR